MKKSIIYIAAIVCAGLTACDDTSDLGTMQKNEQPVAVPADGVTVQALTPATGTSINLNDLATEAQIPLVKMEFNSLFAEGTTGAGTVEMASINDFSDAHSMPLRFAEDTGYITAADLENAFLAVFGETGDAQNAYVRYRLYIAEGSQLNVIYSDPAKGVVWWPASEFNITPLPVETPAQNYYYATGDANNWGFGSNWLQEDADAGQWVGYVGLEGSFKITSTNGWERPYWGLGAGEGLLGEGDEYPNIPVETPGLYFLKADVENLYYILDPIEKIGIVGIDSWEKSDAEFTQVDYWTWTVVYEFKSASTPWKIWMNDGWTYNLGGTARNLYQNGPNLEAPGVGTYSITLDLSTIPYHITYAKQ